MRVNDRDLSRADPIDARHHAVEKSICSHRLKDEANNMGERSLIGRSEGAGRQVNYLEHHNSSFPLFLIVSKLWWTLVRKL
jgi:hypothetical protein